MGVMMEQQSWFYRHVSTRAERTNARLTCSTRGAITLMRLFVIALFAAGMGIYALWPAAKTEKEEVTASQVFNGEIKGGDSPCRGVRGVLGLESGGCAEAITEYLREPVHGALPKKEKELQKGKVLCGWWTATNGLTRQEGEEGEQILSGESRWGTLVVDDMFLVAPANGEISFSLTNRRGPVKFKVDVNGREMTTVVGKGAGGVWNTAFAGENKCSIPLDPKGLEGTDGMIKKFEIVFGNGAHVNVLLSRVTVREGE